MAVEVAIVPRCAECEAVWPPADPERWRLRLDVDGELAWFCLRCDGREFG